MGKTRRKKRAKSSIRRKLLTVIVLGAILAGFLAIHFDRQVVARLTARHQGHGLSAVYSIPAKIDLSKPSEINRLRAELVAREYREVEHPPELPGSYRITNDTIEVYARPYRTPTGRLIAAELTRSVKGAADKTISLEPRFIAPLGAGERRASTYTKLSDVPKHVVQAIVSIEDERFYDHFGIDLAGILRALFANIRAGKIVQGGSTLTQQLAKNMLLTPERTIGRKLLEIGAAISIEWHFTKDEILELYLNEVYLGQEGPIAIHGVAEATRAFYGKDLKEITVSEAALLAGLIRAPSLYSPRRHYERAISRRNTVLAKMRDLGVINRDGERAAKAKRIAIAQGQSTERSAPYFVDAVTRELGDRINLNSAILAGVQVYTGLDTGMQICAKEAVDSGLAKLEQRSPGLKRAKKPLEMSLVAIEPETGLIRAWIGGRDYTKNQFNHVDQARRQIGSTIKPFVYLTALDIGLNSYKRATTRSILSDRPTEVELPSGQVWEPENFDREFRGDVTLRYALERSLNIPAVYIAERVGIRAVRDTTEAFRLSDEVPPIHALALGALDTNLLRLTAAYGALANGGVYVSPRLYVTAIDPSGTILSENAPMERRIADQAATFVLNNVLQGVINRGTGQSIRSLGYDTIASGKTGTSNDGRDAWFVGFTPNLVAGVWVGFDDNKQTGLTGGSGAAPVWASFMKCAEKINPPRPFTPPSNVVFVEVDGLTNTRASSECPVSDRITEVFVRGSEPTLYCTREQRESPQLGRELELPRRAGDSTKSEELSFWERLVGR